MKMHKLTPIMRAIARHDRIAALMHIESALSGETGKAWRSNFAKLAEVIGRDVPRFSILARDGNQKLPFLAFSSLPGEGFCPGAGECLKFCYSFKAHRYPAAFARQAQNSWLMHSGKGRAQIVAALNKFEPSDGEPIDFRLYVDGDFSNVDHVAFWMDTIRARPWLRAYGYSKSFRELLSFAADGGTWPANYRLNLSSGHKHATAVVKAVSALPITRGEFVAVDVGRKVKSAEHGTRELNAELRAKFGRKAFTCPGKCGTCTPKGHACGSDRFAGIPVIIAAH